jgi:hypothetical protein
MEEAGHLRPALLRLEPTSRAWNVARADTSRTTDTGVTFGRLLRNISVRIREAVICRRPAPRGRALSACYRRYRERWSIASASANSPDQRGARCVDLRLWPDVHEETTRVHGRALGEVELD